MRLQTVVTLLPLAISTTNGLPIEKSWTRDDLDVDPALLMGGNLASLVSAAWKRFDTFVREHHYLLTDYLSQHERDVIGCAQRAIENKDYLASKPFAERAETAWRNCEENPQWDPAVEMCTDRATENGSFMPGKPSDQRREAARKQCQENPNWDATVEMKRPSQEISDQWTQWQQQREESTPTQDGSDQIGKDSKDTSSPGPQFNFPHIPQDSLKRLGEAIGRPKFPMRMTPMPMPVLIP